MCGVVSIVYGKNSRNLGKVGGDLLKKLEYRGYDSTGGAFFREDGSYKLRKKVGAPSRVTEILEMDKLRGKKFIGQVRWATYGSVTDENAQPHAVNCHVHLVGAHNGNISNTDTLKEFLLENGHTPVSDNDGEMLVHLIEHYYNLNIKKSNRSDLNHDEKLTLFINAIRKAEKTASGSYAACVTAPDIEGVFAIKSGSSLYAGKGEDEDGEFIVVSSDLTSVLSKTRFLIPLVEGECVYFTHNDYIVHDLNQETSDKPALKRSRLNVADISLAPKYHYFMEQEIYSTPSNFDNLLRYYFNDDSETVMFDIFEDHLDECRELLYALLKLYDVFDETQLTEEFEKIKDSEGFKKVFSLILEKDIHFNKRLQSEGFVSEEATLLDEILGLNEKYQGELLVLDTMLVWKKKRIIIRFKDKTIENLKTFPQLGGRIFITASGTSFHAALVAAYFFNNLTDIAVIPVNPGMFRSMYMNSINENDMIIGVSQSGETKDLVDIFSDLREKFGRNIPLITIVNNENSTLPQEKSSYYLPVMCGPEIAVAATKSFSSQMGLFYILAAGVCYSEDEVRKKIEKIRYYTDFTMKSCDPDVREVALNMFDRPSIHILGTSLTGLSKEGALKIREVVLNHTEGYDSAEFKHGPNTILGKNTLFSLTELEQLHGDMLDVFKQVAGNMCGSSKSEYKSIIDTLKNFQLGKVDEKTIKNFGNGSSQDVFECLKSYIDTVNLENYFSNYPLIFACPPDERDVRITISQVHTHKIRGADIVMIAEDDKDLEKAVAGWPAGFEHYFNKFLKIPSTGDKNMFVFQATVVLQLLALRMSVEKMKVLNRLKVENHGVHPDVPKNVSKSITVD